MHSLAERPYAVMVRAKGNGLIIRGLAAHRSVKDMVDFSRRLDNDKTRSCRVGGKCTLGRRSSQDAGALPLSTTEASLGALQHLNFGLRLAKLRCVLERHVVRA
jgi:hypothetical protein